MKLYVGVTDTDWFRYLHSNKVDEMNFWRPRAASQFKVLKPGELFCCSQNILIIVAAAAHSSCVTRR